MIGIRSQPPLKDTPSPSLAKSREDKNAVKKGLQNR